MSDNTPPEQPTCRDNETQGILHPEAHDLVEVEQDLIWEIDDCAAYKTISECQRDGCTSEFRGVTVIGRKIESVHDFKAIAYQIYESYYENPRNIPFLVLQRLIETSDTGELNTLAYKLCDAAQLGCDDADADRELRSKEELLDVIVSD